MHDPSTPIAISFEHFLQELPKDYEQIAAASLAFQRGGKVRKVEELIRLLFTYCCTDLSFRSTAAAFTLVYGRQISDTAVRNRIIASESFLEKMLQSLMIPQQRIKPTMFNRVIAVDGSIANALASKGTNYRYHFGIELFSGELTHAFCSDYQKGERFGNFKLEPGDLVVADRGYCHQTGLAYVLESKARAIVRFMPHRMRLQTREGKDLDLMPMLKKHKSHTTISLAVQIDGAKTTKLWLRGCWEKDQGNVSFKACPKE